MNTLKCIQTSRGHKQVYTCRLVLIEFTAEIVYQISCGIYVITQKVNFEVLSKEIT